MVPYLVITVNQLSCHYISEDWIFKAGILIWPVPMMRMPLPEKHPIFSVC
jgi:hypothetical protein